MIGGKKGDRQPLYKPQALPPSHDQSLSGGICRTPPSGQVPPPLQCLACPACQPGPPQSSVPWHAGALCSPRSLRSLKGPLAFPSTPGAPGLLSQRHILSTRSRDAPVHTVAVCCSLPGPGLRTCWNSSCVLPEAPPGCPASWGNRLPRGKCHSPSQTCAPCPAPFLEDCCPCHPISQSKRY